MIPREFEKAPARTYQSVGPTHRLVMETMCIAARLQNGPAPPLTVPADPKPQSANVWIPWSGR